MTVPSLFGGNKQTFKTTQAVAAARVVVTVAPRRLKDPSKQSKDFRKFLA